MSDNNPWTLEQLKELDERNRSFVDAARARVMQDSAELNALTSPETKQKLERHGFDRDLDFVLKLVEGIKDAALAAGKEMELAAKETGRGKWDLRFEEIDSQIGLIVNNIVFARKYLDSLRNYQVAPKAQ